MARTLALLGSPPEQIDDHLRQAIANAPVRPEPAAFLGSLLLFRDPGSTEGRELLGRALLLDSGYEPALKFHRRLGVLPGQQDSTQPESTRAGALWEALLAEQFGVSEQGPERILGAGIMAEPEEVLATVE
jgi:hypothetical protein